MKQLALGLFVLALAACRASSPTAGPEARCADACKAHASKCSETECARGCRLMMDRLVEREGAPVLACVARAVSDQGRAQACNDATFADCASRAGIHADGGPPAPPPRTDVDLAGEDDEPKKKDDGDDLILRLADDRGRELLFTQPPKRVVSLVPSDTLNVAALGCGAALVGRTDYCELPADLVANLPSVGGTKNPRVDDVCALEPDLVLANQEENTKGDLEAIAQRGFRVYVAFPKRVEQGISHLAKLARIFHVERDAGVRALIKRGYDAYRAAEAERARRAPVRTFCPIWMSPLMTIDGATFISDMLDLCGAQNVFADRERRYPLAADLGKATPLPPEKVEGRDVRYPRVTMEEVTARAPELVLLPDEPHPFTEADADLFRAQSTPAAARGAVIRTNGKDLCWYGARSVEGIERVRAIIDAHRPA